mgnify:CR=1 FL=1
MTATSPYLNRPLRSYSVAALERLRTKLEEALNACIAAEADDIKGYIEDALGDTALMIREQEEADEPCTAEAYARGCTCRMESVHPTMIDPPEPIIDRFCPLHGRDDPDRKRDEMLDERVTLFDEAS